MASTLSNNFNVTINRYTPPPTNPKKVIESNNFNVTINRATSPSYVNPSTVIEITKLGVALTPVNTTPTTGQYKVTITNTVNCVAKLERDYKTITVTSATSNKGQIDISINIENKQTYTKSIPVATMLKTNEVNKKMSEVKQTADALTAKFNDGFNMGIIEQTVNGIKVYHNEINGENYTHMAPSGFYIKYKGEDIFVCNQNGLSYKGNITGSTINGGTIKGTEVIGGSLNVEGVLTAGKIVCKDIDNLKYPGVVTENLWLYVSTSGNDDSALESGATFETFEGLLDKLPKNLNGHEIRIEMSTDITENIEFRGYHGGRIRVLMKGHTLYGYVYSVMGSAKIIISSGYIGNNYDDSNGWGKIHPSKGYAVGNYTTTCACYDSGSISLYNIDVYGADNYLSGSTNKVGVAASDWGSVYMNKISFYGCDIGARANAGGRMYDTISYNVCAKYGWVATTGGYISLAGNSHSGGKTTNYQQTDGGQVIVGSGATFEGGEVQVPGGSAPVISTKTVIIKSKSGDTYRSTVYNSYKGDNTV